MSASQLKWLGAALALVGLVELVVGFSVGGLGGPFGVSLCTLLVGFGAFLGCLDAVLAVLRLPFIEAPPRLRPAGDPAAGLAGASSHQLSQPALDVISAGGVSPAGGVPMLVHLGVGAALWVLGWVVLARAIARERRGEPVLSHAAGRPLHPRLATYQDFHWGTLAAYGFGIFLAEVGFLAVYLALVGRGAPGGTGVDGAGLPPGWAAAWAFFAASTVACVAGFLGAANSRRHSTPEATLAILYFGLGLPLLLTVMNQVPGLTHSLGYRMREISYLASLLGDTRPELGYWLVTAALAIALVLGINAGFVATSSGRLDLRASFELFVASRHVSVFRPKLLLGVFAVLIFGVIPPLIVAAMVRAAAAAVERTRIRRLGLADPLLAAEALNAVKTAAQTPTTTMTSLSVGGVGVGVMALIIVLSVMSGFEADLQKKILGTNSHGVVLKYSAEMPEYDEVMKKLAGVPGLTGLTPFILNEVMISSEGNISGAMIKGVDPATVGSVTDLPEYVQPGGSLQWLEKPERISPPKLVAVRLPAADLRPAQGALDGGAAVSGGSAEAAGRSDGGAVPSGSPAPVRAGGAEDDAAPGEGAVAGSGAGGPRGGDDFDPLVEVGQKGTEPQPVLPGIVIGRELAASLRVLVGDRVNVVSPLGGELGPQGPMPKSRPFRVAGIFYSGMYEYDSKFVYIHLREARSFFGVDGAMGLEVRVADVDKARSVMKAVLDRLDGYPFRTKDWGEMNRNLFSALRLEKLVMAIILSIIVIVAAGLIVATVVMLVLEKRKEIAVLKALGVSDGGVVKIFLSEGLQIGVVGGLLGLVAGLAWCVFIERVGIRLDPQVYYIPALPVRIEPFQTVLAVLVAVLVTFLASIYPALKAAQVDPVDGLKSE